MKLYCHFNEMEGFNYTGEEWRDAAGYDLCLDSAALGEDGCVERIIKLLPGFIN